MWGQARPQVDPQSWIGAILAVLVFLWFVIAIVNPPAATILATGVAGGFREMVTGLGEFFAMF